MYQPFDHEARERLFERIGETGSEKIDPTGLPEGVELNELTIDALWQTWAVLTFQMLAVGFSHRTLCDAAGEIVPVREEATERATQTA